MEYVKLGSTGLDVSRICLGCMTYGAPDRGSHSWTLDEERSRPLIKQALELGINFLDTANVYSDGSSEEIVGRAIKDFSRRDDVVLATKVCSRMRPGPNGPVMVLANATISDLTGFLQLLVLDRPVVDHTGLTGRYDINVAFTPDDSLFNGNPPLFPKIADGVEPAPSLFDAFQQQIGLKLAAEKTQVDVIVIDHVEKASAN